MGLVKCREIIKFARFASLACHTEDEVMCIFLEIAGLYQHSLFLSLSRSLARSLALSLSLSLSLSLARSLSLSLSLDQGYEPYKGDLEGIRKGVLVSMKTGTSTLYSLDKLQARGVLFIHPGAEIYPGMIIGEHSRDNDLEVSICTHIYTCNIYVLFMWIYMLVFIHIHLHN